MELRNVTAVEALPNMGRNLVLGRFVNLEVIFGRGEHLKLDPVVLLTDLGELLTWDGHHRLTNAHLEGVAIPAQIYTPDDEFIVTDSGLKMPLTKRHFSAARIGREIAIEMGHRTFADLYHFSFGRIRFSDFFFTNKHNPVG